MDVLDAGVFVAKWEAEVPKLQTVLWGPLQAKEMGFEGWEWQDGGETGFVAHNPHIRLPAGFATSTLIVQNRKRRAFLTVYFGGYPVDAPAAQRRTDQQKVVSSVEAFLSRLAKKPVALHLQGEVALVDSVNDHAIEVAAEASPAVEERSGVWDV